MTVQKNGMKGVAGITNVSNLNIGEDFCYSELKSVFSKIDFLPILDSMPDICLFYSTDLKIQWYNKAAEKALNIKNTDVIDSYCFELWHNRYSPCINCPVVKSFKSKQIENRKIHSPDGYYWDLMAVPVLNGSNEVTGIFEFARDITHQEQMVEKDKLVSIIAHDLKNPFNSIIGYSDLFLEETNDFSKEDFTNFFHQLRELAKQGSGLLDNLLHWSKTQPESFAMNVRKINLSKIMQENAEYVKSQIFLKNLTLHIKCNDNVFVLADPDILSTIIRNLLSNAIKYTPKNGLIQICGRENNNTIKITITDNGVGMKRETLKSLFQINKMHSTPGTENEKGTGLGLMICREFIEKCGGELFVESRENVGTSFSFSLPLAQA